MTPWHLDLRLADVLASMGELKKAQFGEPPGPEVTGHNMAETRT